MILGKDLFTDIFVYFLQLYHYDEGFCEHRYYMLCWLLGDFFNNCCTWCWFLLFTASTAYSIL